MTKEDPSVGTQRSRGRPDTGQEAQSKPRPFTSEDFALRMSRAVQKATEADLDRLIVAPGPDLQYLCGYVPTAVLERPTLLFLSAGREPSMLVPVLELPDAQEAPGAGPLSFLTYKDGQNPYSGVLSLLDQQGAYGVSDSCWAMHVLGLQRELPRGRFRSLSEALPMLRAVKDKQELDAHSRRGCLSRRVLSVHPGGSLRRPHGERRLAETCGVVDC